MVQDISIAKTRRGFNSFSLATIIMLLLYVMPQTMLFIKNDMLAIIATVYYAVFVSKYVSPVFLLRSIVLSIPYLIAYWLNGFPGDFKLGFVLPLMTLITLIIPCFTIIAVKKRNNISEQKTILIATGLCLLYIAISSLRALAINPLVMRDMAGGADEMLVTARMNGVGGYGIAYSFGALFIALWGIRKIIKGSFLPPYLLLIVSGILIVQSQYATLLFITIFGVALYYLLEAKTISRRVNVLIVSILVIVLSPTIIKLGMQMTNLNVLSYKFELIYDGIWGDSGVDNISGDRSQFQLNAFNLFQKSPIFGYSGFIVYEAYQKAHSTIISVLASTGIVGILSYLGMFYTVIKQMIVCCFNNANDKKLYYPIIAYYVAFAFLNPIDFSFECSWVIFFVIPLLYIMVFSSARK